MKNKIKNMAKKKFYEIDPVFRGKILNNLYQIISELRNKQDVRKFLSDLLTPGESVMIAYRIEVAKMLLKGFGYEDIQRKLKVGASTINSVNKWLYSGFGGYMKALKKAENQKERKAVIPTNEWEMLKKKYPAHFYIFNLLDKFKK
jgi:TrpR-related protein YerC/YecD